MVGDFWIILYTLVNSYSHGRKIHQLTEVLRRAPTVFDAKAFRIRIQQWEEGLIFIRNKTSTGRKVGDVNERNKYVTKRNQWIQITRWPTDWSKKRVQDWLKQNEKSRNSMKLDASFNRGKRFLLTQNEESFVVSTQKRKPIFSSIKWIEIMALNSGAFTRCG